MSTTATTIDPERQMLGEVGGDPSSGGCGRIDSGDCSRTGPGPQDGAAMPAADGVAAAGPRCARYGPVKANYEPAGDFSTTHRLTVRGERPA